MQAPLNGNETHPVIRYLKEHLPGGNPETGQLNSNFDIKGPWTKFLVNRQGMPIKFYGGRNGCDRSDDAIEADILAEIDKPRIPHTAAIDSRIASA
jgi:glutathione peroxidase-family protein